MKKQDKDSEEVFAETLLRVLCENFFGNGQREKAYIGITPIYPDADGWCYIVCSHIADSGKEVRNDFANLMRLKFKIASLVVFLISKTEFKSQALRNSLAFRLLFLAMNQDVHIGEVGYLMTGKLFKKMFVMAMISLGHEEQLTQLSARKWREERERSLVGLYNDELLRQQEEEKEHKSGSVYWVIANALAGNFNKEIEPKYIKMKTLFGLLVAICAHSMPAQISTSTSPFSSFPASKARDMILEAITKVHSEFEHDALGTYKKEVGEICFSTLSFLKTIGEMKFSGIMLRA